MVGLFSSLITVSFFLLIIVFTRTLGVLKRRVNRSLHTAVLEHGFFNFLLVARLHDLHLLHMLYSS